MLDGDFTDLERVDSNIQYKTYTTHEHRYYSLYYIFATFPGNNCVGGPGEYTLHGCGSTYLKMHDKRV